MVDAYGAVFNPTTGCANNGLDIDNDRRCERALIWDADQDGSENLVTCVDRDDPFPQCWYPGHVIRTDTLDDVNCMLLNTDGSTRCGATYAMERGGVIELQPGTMNVAFACWDVGAWLADPNTPGAAPCSRVPPKSTVTPCATTCTTPSPFASTTNGASTRTRQLSRITTSSPSTTTTGGSAHAAAASPRQIVLRHGAGPSNRPRSPPPLPARHP